MIEAASFLLHQPVVLHSALYLAALVFLCIAGGTLLTLTARILDRIGAALTSNPDWETRGATSKEETLLLIAVLLYAQVLVSLEPTLRACSSALSAPLFTLLILAPIAGALHRRASFDRT